MRSKHIEIRDRGTFIPALIFKLDPQCEAERYLMARAGYGTKMEDQRDYVFLMRADDCKAYCDPAQWGDRTMATAHFYAQEHFETINSGDVVDVEFILKESKTPKTPERSSQ